MDAIRQIQEIKTYVKDLFLHDTTGHDVEHMQRVAQLAVYIAEKKAQIHTYVRLLHGYMM
ncbi:hypothetical protein [Paracerasibacillus soli]|uniref:Uncharacterized protein n=1 Tax=Paracerasibacillus soli TaxID=480284 RepID=A0ABU5CPX8_9BACI|nr:hypothetical protein [Virgibacillus soli]MDY0408275.1 hypothetical protein [Virgibacillus soli]